MPAVPCDSPAGAQCLMAGAAIADITPPLDVGLLMSSVDSRWAPFEGVRRRLNARVLALDACGEKVVLVSLDLLGLNSKSVGGWARFKRALTAKIPGLRSSRLVLTCTHSHTAPESVALTTLYQTPQFKLWIAGLQRAVAASVGDAVAAMKPCTLAIGSAPLREFSLQRRIPTRSGIKMSDGLQPVPSDWLDREPIDHRVRALIFRSLAGPAIATVGVASCHPVHEMCIPRISPDFPGEFCAAIEAREEMGIPLFLNGTAGDVNPPTVSMGPEAAIRHGRALALTVINVSKRAGIVAPGQFHFVSKSLSLPTRTAKGTPSRRACTARISALRLGPIALLFLPGEIFVETGRNIELRSPFPNTIVLGFAESTIGYVPTPRAFREGGYETGPGKWSFLQSTAEPLLVQGALQLLKELWRGMTLRNSRKSSSAMVLAH